MILNREKTYMSISEEARMARNKHAKQYRADNLEKCRAYEKAWRAKNKDKIAVYMERYWAKKAQETDNNG